MLFSNFGRLGIIIHLSVEFDVDALCAESDSVGKRMSCQPPLHHHTVVIMRGAGV